MENEVLAYEAVLWFGLVAMIFGGGGLFAATLLRRQRPYVAKLTPYESGEEAEGEAQGRFHPRFYVVGLIFLLFEAELLFLFPWATVYAGAEATAATGGSWALFCLAEITVFLFLLVLGLVYAWRKGYLDWERDTQRPGIYISPVPPALYSEINNRYKKVIK